MDWFPGKILTRTHDVYQFSTVFRQPFDPFLDKQMHERVVSLHKQILGSSCPNLWAFAGTVTTVLPTNITPNALSKYPELMCKK